MHGVLNVVARDEDIAFHVGECHIRHDETVALLMKDQPAPDFVARHCLVLRKLVRIFLFWAFVAFCRDVGLGGLSKKEAAVSELLDETAFLQFLEHLEHGTALVLLETKGARELLERDGVVSKFKKTQDVINA